MLDNKKIICFDIDGVICKTKGLNYLKSKPIKKNIKKINDLYDRGYYIKLFTARYMGRSKENVFIASKKNFKVTVPQLKKWGVKYHQVIFGKPTYSIFIDDKNLFHKIDWEKSIDKVIKKNKL
jgi:hypothetical protein